MANSVLVCSNSANATEDHKFRMEYSVVGVGRQNFDWQPDFTMDSTELLADLKTLIIATILARHGLTIDDAEIIILGVPITSHA